MSDRCVDERIKVKVPRIYDLGCNGKARVVEFVCGNIKKQFLLSYDTVIAVQMWKGDTKEVLRLVDEIPSSTSTRHWNAFCRYIDYHDGKASFMKTKRADPV